MVIRNRDEVGGKVTRGAGIVKEKLGRATGSRRLQESGAADRTVGGVRSGVGKAARKVNKAIDDAAADLRKP